MLRPNRSLEPEDHDVPFSAPRSHDVARRRLIGSWDFAHVRNCQVVMRLEGLLVQLGLPLASHNTSVLFTLFDGVCTVQAPSNGVFWNVLKCRFFIQSWGKITRLVDHVDTNQNYLFLYVSLGIVERIFASTRIHCKRQQAVHVHNASVIWTSASFQCVYKDLQV